MAHIGGHASIVSVKKTEKTLASNNVCVKNVLFISEQFLKLLFTHVYKGGSQIAKFSHESIFLG